MLAFIDDNIQHNNYVAQQVRILSFQFTKVINGDWNRISWFPVKTKNIFQLFLDYYLILIKNVVLNLFLLK